MATTLASRLDKFAIYATLVIAAFYAMLCLYEFYDTFTNAETYIRVFGIGEASENWRFKSMGNFRFLTAASLIVSVLVGATAYLRLKYSGKVLFYMHYFFILCFVIWQIRYYYLFYKSGFDHYPGFDPYIF